MVNRAIGRWVLIILISTAINVILLMYTLQISARASTCEVSIPPECVPPAQPACPEKQCPPNPKPQCPLCPECIFSLDDCDKCPTPPATNPRRPISDVTNQSEANRKETTLPQSVENENPSENGNWEEEHASAMIRFSQPLRGVDCGSLSLSPAKEVPVCDHHYSADASCSKKETFFVYRSGDFVSRSGGNWQSDLISYLLNAMRFLESQHPDKEFVMLDIGANVGSFGFHFAVRGYNVIMVEPMKDNYELLERSICNSPLFTEKISLVKKGVGNEEAECHIWSVPVNKGNGQVSCHPPGHHQERPCPDCVRLGDVSVTTVDVLFAHYDWENYPIGVAKMDIEALEPKAVMGGQNTFCSGKIPYMIMEFSHAYLEDRSNISRESFADMLHDCGYRVFCCKDQCASGHQYFEKSDWVRNFGKNDQFDVMLVHMTAQDLPNNVC